MQFGHEFKKGKTPKPDYFEEDSIDIKKIFLFPHSTKQDQVIYHLFYESGIRLSELTNLKINDMNLKKREAVISKGKGGGFRTAWYDEDTAKLLEDHIEGIKLHYPFNESLFVNEDGKPLQSEALKKRMLRRGMKIKIKMNPHKFRHSAGTRIYSNSGDLKLTSVLLGHESLSSTNLYVHLSNSKTRDLYDKFNKSKIKIEQPSSIFL